MSTEAAAADNIPSPQAGPYAQPSPYEIERRMFNTGPCANKTLPTDFQVIGKPGRPELNAGGSSPDQLLPPPEEKSSSNISGAGGGGGGGSCCSDTDVKPGVIPSAVSSSQSAKSGNATVVATSEEKKPRKRKRVATDQSKPDTPQKLDKFGRKITEYISSKTSPKRSAISYQLATNGDSLSGELAPLCTSPVPGGGGNLTMAGLNNRTPVMLAGQYASSSSDSNQSPPSSSSALRVDVEIQTEACSIEMEGSAKFLHQLQQDKIKEEILKQNAELTKNLEAQKAKVRASKETIKRLLIKQSRMERKQAKEKCMENALRIGQFKPTRSGENFKEQWNDGYAMEEISQRLQKIQNERNEIQNATQNLRKRKTTGREPKISRQSDTQTATTSSGSNVSNPTGTSSSAYTDDGFLKPELPKEMTPQEFLEQEEIYRLRKEHLKREETELLAEKERLERERNIHIREMKRVQYEESSRFRDVESLNNRYLLLQLLGKGGFSEVWRAFDLDECRYVACKIHHVHKVKEWKEDKKANYVKHAMREKDIHKLLDHPRIVRLFDLFTIDQDTFCTVLEYCDGNDLDFYLKQHKQIPEKEARLIIMQIVNALKYLSERKHPIIHYDLKPANILLSSGTPGEIKITDFGLSKELESEDDDESIELTSQGAGTYWYLPPETFRTSIHGEPPTINLKVDVWSVGVIFYQCLYGKRPFGHELSQQRILQENTILNATEVTFPSKPQVSAAAHDFIRRCLQCKKEERADINELAKHELFKPRGQKSLQPPSPSSIGKSNRVDSMEEI